MRTTLPWSSIPITYISKNGIINIISNVLIALNFSKIPCNLIAQIFLNLIKYVFSIPFFNRCHDQDFLGKDTSFNSAFNTNLSNTSLCS